MHSNNKMSIYGQLDYEPENPDWDDRFQDNNPRWGWDEDDQDEDDQDVDDWFGQGQEIAQHQDTFLDRERAGGVILGCWNTDKDGKPLKTQTPLGRFCLFIYAISYGIKADCHSIDEEGIKTLLSLSQKIPRVEFKNPTAFVLGYIATRGGRYNITRDSLSSVWKCYQQMHNINKDESITEEDIIRYARFWRTPAMKQMNLGE